MQNVFVLFAPTTAWKLYRQIVFSYPLVCSVNSIEWLALQLSFPLIFLGNKNSKYEMHTLARRGIIGEQIAENITSLGFYWFSS